MKTVGLLTRPDFKVGIEQTHQILSSLEARKLLVRMPTYLAKALKRSELGSSIENMKVDFVMTLGGDGTTLYAARHLPPEVPILPVNLESFGFLAECEIEEVQKLIDDVMTGKLSVQETLRLATFFKKKQFPDAANEVSVFPLEKGRPIQITLQIGESPVFDFRADGFLITTPMGSTGHALSLGGPILTLDLDALLLLPVAPLRFGFHPLIVSSFHELQIRLRKQFQVIIDGDLIDQIPSGEQLIIRKSDTPLRLLRRPSQFYTRLQRKLLRC